MLWFLFLLFTCVRADDDSLDFGPPELPPLENANIDKQMQNVLVDQFYGAYQAGTGNKRPRFTYPKHLYYNTELFTLMQDCYDAGMAPPLKYPIDMTIWDNRWSRLKRVEKGTYYCAPGFTEKWYWTWKKHSNQKSGIESTYPNYNPEELEDYKHDLLTSFKTQTSLTDPPEVIASAISGGTTGATAAVAGAAALTGGVSLAANGAIAAAGFAAGYAGARAAACDLGEVKDFYCMGTTGQETAEDGNLESGTIRNIPYPVSDEEIKWTAPAYVRKTYALYEEAPSTYCSLWNTISGNGIEYFRPPKVLMNKTRTCKDYKLGKVWLCTKDVTEMTTDDTRQLEFIENHPNLLMGDTFYEACNHPSNLFCQADSNTREISENLWRNAYAEPTPYGLDTTVLKDAVTMPVGEMLLTAAAQFGQSVGNVAYAGTLGTIGGIGRLAKYYFTEFDTSTAAGYNYKYSSDDIVQPVLDKNELEWVQGKIVEAQTAVMAWAQSDCHSYNSGESWSPDAEFACLIGVNDIEMKGASQTIPLGTSGIGAGLLLKHVAKRGVSIITKGHYTYCVSSTEYAFMAGEKFTLSPVAFRKKDVTKLLGKKSGKTAGKKAQKAAASKNKNTANKAVSKKRQIFNKCRGFPYCKAAAKTQGRESARASRQEIEKNSNVKLKFIYEFWQEYGTCDDGCDFTAKESNWDLVAGSMSFFTAKTALSRLRVWDNEYPKGWYRYLHQVYAHVSLVPNPVQVAFAFSGGLVGVLAEFQIGMETARGEGNRDPANIFGNALTADNMFGTERDWIIRSSRESIITLAPTEMTKYGISKDVLYIKSFRRRLSSDVKHSVPDIAIAETLSLDTKNPIRLNKRGMVIERYINITQSNIDLSRLDSIIYGVQDDILEAESLVNPFRYTTLDESTLELEYNPAPYHVIDLNSCELAGFTSVHLLDHTFNSVLKDKIFNYMETQPIDTSDLNGDTYTYSERTINFQKWRHDGSEWYYDGDSSPKTMTLDDGTSVTVDPNDPDMHEEVVENDIKGADRPVGLIFGPLKENGVSDLRQTTYDLYGAFGSSGGRQRHTSCSPEMKCVCVHTSGYRYMRYGDIGDEYKDGSYMINPVYTSKECTTAIHSLDNDDYLTFTQWTIVSEGLNETVELKPNDDGAFRGCVKEGNAFYFYKGEGGNMGSLGDDSIVRLHKLSIPSIQTYSGDIINVYREKPFMDMKTIHTSIDHQAVGHHIFEEGHPVWFPKYKYNAIKDKNAHYTVHNGDFKTIRRVDRYYKRNKDVVEEYYIDEEGAPTLEYMELKSMSARSNIYGETTLVPGAHFIATALTVGSGVIVHKMDFVRDGKVAFIGEKISMDVLPCRSLFKYTGNAQYCKDEECETIPGENFICGEVSPPTLENSMSCDRSRSLPNTCPVGYGMDGDGADINGVPFKIGDLRQCAKCPIVSTCNHVCKRCLNGDPDTCDNPQDCKECLSPSGSYRCNVDLTYCDKPGYMKTYTRRGGTGAQVSTHCVKTFEEPDFLPWQTSTLQKYHHEKGNPFYPVEHEYDEKRYIQNELYSETRYLVCQPGFVPTQKLVTSITEYAQTCAGYTCERCPDGFYEKDQICMKCPNRQIANTEGTGCEYVPVPKGHFFDLTNKQDNFVTSCDHWLDHPGGSMGAYQDEENQIMCKTVNTTKEILGSHPVMFKGGIVEYWGESGWRVSQDRTQAVQCGEHQVCNGEEVSGCKPGYIWTEFSENRDFDPCQECNANEDIFSKHPERDNYEYCDGSHRFRCAKFSYTNATVDTFRAHTGNHSQAGDIFVGVRASWNGSNLVLPRTERRGDMYRTFDWSNEFNPASPRAEQYVYNANFEPRRYPENEAFNRDVKCEPVPNGTFALPDKWQKTDCGAARELCVHRTFHSIVPFKPNCADVPYYPFTSKAVKEECYDYIYRMEDRICTDGLKQSGVEKPETLKCKKDYCNIEGQSNCWCGDEEDFCTMGCVDGLCQDICGDRVCEEYELCYGEFNQFVSFARCAIKCQAPRSNFCVIEDAEGNAVFCRHYNEDWNSTIMQKLEPKPTGPCFDEVPSIPETQCRDVFDTSCFCGREFFDPPHTHEDNRFACHEKKLKPFCSVLQDDGTCIYETSSDGKCLCGLDEIDLTLSGSRCYSDDEGSCGVYARGKPMCEDHVHSESDGGCIAGNMNIADNMNCYNGDIVNEYLTIDGDVSYRCVQDGDVLKVKGCMDPLSDIHNPYATIPGKCKY